MKKIVIEINNDDSVMDIIDKTLIAFNQMANAEEPVQEEKKINEDPHYYLNKISNNINMPKQFVPSFLKNVHNIAPVALLNMILNVVAHEIDLLYEGHINECPVVYVLNTLQGKIVSIPTNDLKKVSYKYFAAFRTQEEAVFAVRIADAIKRIVIDGGK